MLFTCLSVLLGQLIVSQAAKNITEDTPNYFIDSYQDGLTYYAYPMDICLRTGITGGDWVIYTCTDDDTTVTKTIFDDSECQTETVNASIVFDVNDIEDNGIFDFNCGGITSYVELKVCISDETCNECTIGGTTYSVVNVCHYGGDGMTTASLYSTCDENGASVSTYSNQTVCEGEPSITLNAESACSYFTTFPFGLGTVDLYSTVQSCVIDDQVIFEAELPSTSMEPDNSFMPKPKYILFISLLTIIKMFA